MNPRLFPILAGLLLLLLTPSLLPAAPRFGGVKEALPGPASIYLWWDRAAAGPGGGTITYNVYLGVGGAVDYSRPAARVKGPDWVLTGLRPGVPHRVAVRASDATGEERNTRHLTVTPANTLPAEEWRGVWVTRFEWAGGSRAEIEQRLETIFPTLAAARLNAVLFQVRGQGDTLYPSPEEPWSPLLGADARGFDPVARALALARRHGIQFHAWMNLSTIWQSGAKRPPADRNHPYYRFADASNPQRRLGLIHDANGRPRQYGEDDYVWLTHGNPEVNAYLRRQVMHFLRRYNVDGLHWDDRTGNPNGISRDPVSVRRFNGRGNPMGVRDFGEWQRDQLTRFLSDVYTEARAHNPRLLITASPFGIADKNRLDGYGGFKDGPAFGVEPEKWMRQGVLDALMPQIYWAAVDPEPTYGTLVRDWVRHNRSGRPIWPGSNLRRFGAEQPLDPVQVRYVALSRALGLGGNQFYSWSAATPAQWRAAGPKMYPGPARVPVPGHLRPGRRGQVMGNVVDGSGRPVVDCWVRIEGRSYVHLTSADGFFGIPNLSPGNYRLQFSPAPGKVLTRNVTVTADRTAKVRVAVE